MGCSAISKRLPRAHRLPAFGQIPLAFQHRVDGLRVVDAGGSGATWHDVHEGRELLLAFLIQAAQFHQRFGMIIDPEAQARIVLGRVDQQRGRLLAAIIATGGLAGIERIEEALGQRLVR